MEEFFFPRETISNLDLSNFPTEISAGFRPVLFRQQSWSFFGSTDWLSGCTSDNLLIRDFIIFGPSTRQNNLMFRIYTYLRACYHLEAFPLFVLLFLTSRHNDQVYGVRTVGGLFIYKSFRQNGKADVSKILIPTPTFCTFLVNKTNRPTESQFYWYYDSTCFGQPFCPSSGVLSRTSAVVHFMQLWWPSATRNLLQCTVIRT